MQAVSFAKPDYFLVRGERIEIKRITGNHQIAMRYQTVLQRLLDCILAVPLATEIFTHKVERDLQLPPN